MVFQVFSQVAGQMMYIHTPTPTHRLTHAHVHVCARAHLYAHTSVAHTHPCVGGGKTLCFDTFASARVCACLRVVCVCAYVCESRMSLQYHPDKARSNKMDKQCAEENFMDLQAAYTRAQEMCNK